MEATYTRAERQGIFEHVLAGSDLFGNRALAVEVFTRGRVPGKEPRASTVLDQMVAGGDLLFHDFVEEFVSTQVEPRYCVLLKIHEALISSRDQNAALGFTASTCPASRLSG
jgi:hypothetical protein